MPYYVYAIHTDHTDNRRYGRYENLEEAEKMEREMRLGNYPSDNYRVHLMYAENDIDADKKADTMRTFPKISKEK